MAMTPKSAGAVLDPRGVHADGCLRFMRPAGGELKTDAVGALARAGRTVTEAVPAISEVLAVIHS